MRLSNVYSDTWSWLKLDKKNELVLNRHIKERLNATITMYELNKKRKNNDEESV